MQIFRGIHHAALARRAALTIGNFDGVHLGHQAMLAQLVAAAKSRDLVPTVLTFDPHPREFFATLAGRADAAPAPVSTLRDKAIALRHAGIEQLIILRFDAALAALTPDQFLDRIVRDGAHARHVLVGDDFRFGAGRAGDFAALQAHAAANGYTAAQFHTVISAADGQRISSSAVRAALAAGDMEKAADLLGRPYTISSHVLHGAKLGRQLGYPTLNLRLDRTRKPALTGIFVARVHGLGEAPLPAVASLGTRPAVEAAGRPLLEAHVLDWQGDAYAKLVSVELLHKLRDEAPFPDLDSLRAAIARDEAQARVWFAQTRRQTTRDRI